MPPFTRTPNTTLYDFLKFGADSAPTDDDFSCEVIQHFRKELGAVTEYASILTISPLQVPCFDRC